MTPSRSRTRSRSSSPTSEGSWKPVASLGSSIRSAARATYSAYKRQPIRWRLAGGSAALTLVILLGFAVIVGTLTTRAIYKDFNRQVSSAADRLESRLFYQWTRIDPKTDDPEYARRGIDLNAFAASYNAAIRVVTPTGRRFDSSDGAPDFGQPDSRSEVVDGWKVETRPVALYSSDERYRLQIYVQYGR